MVLSFPTPYERLARRVANAVASAGHRQRRQLVVIRNPHESIMDWSQLMARLEVAADIRVVQITDSDALLSWRHWSWGAAS